MKSELKTIVNAACTATLNWFMTTTRTTDAQHGRMEKFTCILLDSMKIYQFNGSKDLRIYISNFQIQF